jgi:hypothetical protein
VGFEPTTPVLKGASAFLTGSQRRLDTKSADFEPPRYLIFRESGSPIWRPCDSRILFESRIEDVHDSPAILPSPAHLEHPHRLFEPLGHELLAVREQEALAGAEATHRVRHQYLPALRLRCDAGR